MDKFGLIFLVGALVCAAFATFRPQPDPASRPHMGWFAILLLLIAMVFTGAVKFFG